MDKDYSSALGNNPTCDICGKYVRVGDVVKQSFLGKVVQIPNDEELAIVETSYSLIHKDCEKKVN